MAKTKKRATTRRKPARPAWVPGHLSVEAAGQCAEIAIEWRVDDFAGRLILVTAFEAFDRMRGAQEILRSDGITQEDRFGQVKPHPACVIERDSRAAFLAAIRQLGIEPDDEV